MLHKALVAFVFLSMTAHAYADDTCPSDRYMNDSGQCVKCQKGYYLTETDNCEMCHGGRHYCPGDDMRYECPIPTGVADIGTPPAPYTDSTLASVILYTSGNVTQAIKDITACMSYEEYSNIRGTLIVRHYYSTDTNKYTQAYDAWWKTTVPGYYMTDYFQCYSNTMFKTASQCPAGTYCPGANMQPCSLGQPSQLGMYTCPDNSYSDAGAASCTPCPNGTGNSGSNLSDHAGVSSCKTISCPAGQEVVNYVCTACKAGYYKASAGSASCTQCTDYKYASGTGNTSCTLPPAGYNSTGCSSGKGCTGQEACGTSWYCPGDGRYYSCPSNSTARTNTSTSADDCLCNSGYVKRSGECKQLCTAGFTTLNSNGVSVNAYADKLTTPAINISANGKTCYVPLVSGSASGAINVSYDSKTYHTVN